MPCTYYSAGEENAMLAEGIKRLQSKLDEATRLLCEVCQAHPPNPNTDLGRWWEKHQEQDRKRLEAEEAERKELERRDKILKENEERKERKELERLLAKYGKK